MMSSPVSIHFRSLRNLLFPGLLVAGGSLALFPTASADQIFFRAGGKMDGSLLQADGQTLQFQHKASASPLPLKRDGVRWVLLNKEGTLPPYDDKVLLTNGDLFPCSINNIDPENIQLQMLNNQVQKVPRNHISSLFFSMGSSIGLISKPQNFAPQEVTGRPEAPSFFSPKKENPLQKKSDAEADETYKADPIISVDEWQGRATRRWKWLGTPENHTLEIPAGRGMISKNIGLTDKFTLKGGYSGPTPELRKSRIGVANNCFGIVIVFGSTYPDASRYLDRNISSNFYSLELLPDAINLCRLSDKNGKRKTILIGLTLSMADKKRGSDYTFELIANGNEFKLSINGLPFQAVIDPVEGDVQTGQISILNTEYIPVILKNLTLTTKISDSAFSAPADLDWDPTHPEQGYLFTQDGDVMPGTLSQFSLKDKRLEWHISKDKGVPKSIGLEFVNSLVLSPPRPDESTPNIKLNMVSGGTFTGTLISLDSENFKLKHSAFGELTIPRLLVRSLELLSTPSPKPEKEQPATSTASHEPVTL